MRRPAPALEPAEKLLARAEAATPEQERLKVEAKLRELPGLGLEELLVAVAPRKRLVLARRLTLRNWVGLLLERLLVGRRRLRAARLGPQARLLARRRPSWALRLAQAGVAGREQLKERRAPVDLPRPAEFDLPLPASSLQAQ